MNEKKHYVSLTTKGSNSYHESGNVFKLGDRIINIGETADCDIRYDNDGLSPEYYATIVKNDDGQSWRIIKRSQHIDVTIVGKGDIGYAHQLSDGDLIKFGNQPMTISFRTHYDNNLDGEKSMTKNGWHWIAMAVFGMLGVVIVSLFMNQRNDICENDVLPFEESIYLVKVDSVSQILRAKGLEQQVKPTKILTNDAPTGTAFLTTDGLLVTARHCVEYWLGKNLDLTTKVSSMSDDDIVKWAVETETFNQNHSGESDSTMQMKVWFSIYNVLGEKKYSFHSTDSRIHINKDKDGIFLMADFNQDFYWRSIRPYFSDKKMAMGDILWIDGITERGKLKMLTRDHMNDIERGTKLMVCGYPMTGTGDKRMITAAGSIKSKPSIDTENLFIESNINHGFSGGPVLMKSGNDIVTIGVVSCVDSVSSGLFKWAVPVTEVKVNQ